MKRPKIDGLSLPEAELVAEAYISARMRQNGCIHGLEAIRLYGYTWHTAFFLQPVQFAKIARLYKTKQAELNAFMNHPMKANPCRNARSKHEILKNLPIGKRGRSSRVEF